MKYDPEKHHRRSIRLKGYDYSQAGAYFVTICTQDRACLFGEVVDGQVRLNEVGKIVEQCWLAIPDHFPNAELDAFVAMPNHLHGIVVLVNSVDVGATHASPLQDNASPLPNNTSPLPNNTSPLPNNASPLQDNAARPHGPQRQSIPAIIGSFKSAVTKRINEYRQTPGLPVWQRNYYEHVIRTDESLIRIRQYIADNPARWDMDRENPDLVRARHASPPQRNEVRATHASPPQRDEPWHI